MDTTRIHRAFTRQRRAAIELRTALIKVVEARHESGRILNAMYPQDIPIPPEDMAELASVNARNYTPEQVAFMRAFAKQAAIKDIPGLIDRYGTWSRICQGYLAPVRERASA